MTFDGSHYDFMGICQYVLMKEDTLPGISVIFNTLACGLYSHGSCVKEVIVRLNGTVIHLRNYGKVSVQGLDTVLPYISTTVKVRQVRI